MKVMRKKNNTTGNNKTTRKNFLKSAVTVAAAGIVTSGCKFDFSSWDEFFQKNYRELSESEKKEMIAELEKKYSKKYGKNISISTDNSIDGTEFGYALDISLCVGCRRCVYSCIEENNQSRNPQVQWIRVLQVKKEDGVSIHHATEYYYPEKVPDEEHFYIPVSCQQCRNPQCITVCPVKATWKEPDGIVVIDYNWCIGCRNCMAACPYGARHFNWYEPDIPKDEINTDTHYLGNRPRYKGVVEKCTFCIQRIRQGRYPACVEICPVGARKFGNMLDPDSEIRYILKNKRVYILKEEINTKPKFFYYTSV